MLNNELNKIGKRKPQEEIVKILAEKYEVSERMVQMVIAGDASNEKILLDYIFYKEEHNLLITKVKKIVPLN